MDRRSHHIFNINDQSIDEVVSKAFAHDVLAVSDRLRLLLKDYLARKINMVKFEMKDPDDKKALDRLLESILSG